jgi:restriction system protein
MNEAKTTIRQSPRFAPAVPSCPKCAAPMALRTAKRTVNGDYRFWGCVAFPVCLGNLPLK